MIEVLLIITGCLVIVIYHLLKRIYHLYHDLQTLTMLFKLKVAAKLCEDDDNAVEIKLEEPDDEQRD